jgi:hypothetical protein
MISRTCRIGRRVGASDAGRSERRWLVFGHVELEIDPSTGCSMAESKGTGCDMPTPCALRWRLASAALGWDDERQTLSIDDEPAAQGTQVDGPVACFGLLHLGCGSDVTVGSFFCRLIDDVRV